MYSSFLVAIDQNGAKNILLFIPAFILETLLKVLPAYIAGWISQDKGTLIGVLVGFIAVTFGFIVSIIITKDLDLSYTELFIKWFNKALLLSIIGGVSGAAGQLHSSAYNMRVQGTADSRRP